MNEIDIAKATSYLEHEAWWEWQIPVYLFLGGIVAGIMVLSSARVLVRTGQQRSDTFRLMTWLAPALLSLGMLALWLDLENRWNVWRFYMAFKPTAPMSWGSWILVGVYPVSILFALAELPDSLRQRVSSSGLGRMLVGISRKAEESLTELAWTNAVLGGAVGVYTGVLLSSLSSRPLWNSAILGPLFLVSGLSTGSALMMLLGVTDVERKELSRIDAGLIALELLVIGLFLVGMATSGHHAQEAAHLVLGGPWTTPFWALVMVGGLGIPLVAEVAEWSKPHSSRWFAPALVLAGGFALRWILVAAGQLGGMA